MALPMNQDTIVIRDMIMTLWILGNSKEESIIT